MAQIADNTHHVPILLLGAVGTSLNIAHQINSDPTSKQRVIGWCVDYPAVGTELNGLPVLANRTNLKEYLRIHPQVRVLFNMYKQGEMQQRLDLLTEINLSDTVFTNYVHPSAFISSGVDLGLGNVVFPNVSIAANVQLGRFNIINYNVVIEHDTELGEGNFLSSGSIVGSNVRIMKSNFIGIGANIRENTTLNNTLVGMGAVVLRDFESSTVVGIPAKALGH